MVAAAAATVDAAMLEHGCMPSLMLRKPNSPATTPNSPSFRARPALWSPQRLFDLVCAIHTYLTCSSPCNVTLSDSTIC